MCCQIDPSAALLLAIPPPLRHSLHDPLVVELTSRVAPLVVRSATVQSKRTEAHSDTETGNEMRDAVYEASNDWTSLAESPTKREIALQEQMLADWSTVVLTYFERFD